MVRKHYDRQFKISAARLVPEGEHPIADLSEMLGISSNSLRRWAAEYQKDGESAFSGNGNPRINISKSSRIKTENLVIDAFLQACGWENPDERLLRQKVTPMFTVINPTVTL